MSVISPVHLQILEFFAKYKSTYNPKEKQWIQHYLGSDKPTQGLKSVDVKKFAKKIIDDNNLNQDQLINLLNSLYQNATSFNEIDLAAKILGSKIDFCKNLDPTYLDNWLNYTHGWAEVDVLCQSNFTSDILLSNWSTWQKLLTKFSNNKNIHKRRASLVLLSKSLCQSNDPKLSQFAFQQIEKLKSEKEILITKAVSWLLRSLTIFHKEELLAYLEKNKESLPKIAYREAFTKATTGRKYKKN